MHSEELLEIIEEHSHKQLDTEQRKVVTHPEGPQWVIAGPGSGKTEVLVVRTLRLLCVDKVNPQSLLVTTFTDKAAKNIQDRIAYYKSILDSEDPDLRDIDVFQARIGTLHGLCNDILQEYRYPGYQNYRLLDEIDQLLFVYEQSTLASGQKADDYLSLWQRFHYLVEGYDRILNYQWQPGKPYPPGRWTRAEATVALFNRIVEDRIDVEELERSTDTSLQVLAQEYNEYKDILDQNRFCDFAHLQLKFLEFLHSDAGDLFLYGDGSDEQPGIAHVLVDEYQDTNPIQEEIYFTLTADEPHNLCVVGDDDQALYRFRGGTVDCMVQFDRVCIQKWNTNDVEPQVLKRNYRSHPEIIEWCNRFIDSFHEMQLEGARAPHKEDLIPDEEWFDRRLSAGAEIGDYPATAYIAGKNLQECAANLANLVSFLKEQKLIHDYNQCVVLMRSTRRNKSGVFEDHFVEYGIPVYNPRDRSFLEQTEIRTALGAIVEIIDPSHVFTSLRDTMAQPIEQWVNEYYEITASGSDLQAYVARAADQIGNTPSRSSIKQSTKHGDTEIPATLMDVFYHVISYEPFTTWQDDPERSLRLGKLSQVLDSYSSLPFPGSPGSTREVLRTAPDEDGILHQGQLNHLYQALFGLLLSKGLDDPQDEEVVAPSGRLPIMTVHQAKGLEFPITFVVGLSESPRVGSDHQMEADFRAYSLREIETALSTDQRATQDAIRFFFVAYSRAEYALIHVINRREMKRGGIGFGGYSPEWYRKFFKHLE